MFVRFLICMCLTVQVIHCASKSNEELRTWFLKMALECSKEHPVTADEMQMLQKQKLPSSNKAKCLVGCVFRKAHFMDDKGMFDADGAIAQAHINHEGDPARIESARKLMESCRKVNSEPVEDGEAGCDRAVIIFKCLNENAIQHGFYLQPAKSK